MRTGLFFGSFNPIHAGHLMIAAHVHKAAELQEVWFVVSPQNPLKDKKSLLNEYDRLELVRTAIEGDSRFRVSDIEFGLPLPSYTIDTIRALESKYPERDWALIMGSDSAATLHKWKEYKLLTRDHRMLVYERPGQLLPPDWELDYPMMSVVADTPLLQISSTYVRKLIAGGGSARYFLPDAVWAEVDKWGYYR